MKDLGDECFGGEQAAFDNWPGKKEPKLNTAYMLFYERRTTAAAVFAGEKGRADVSHLPRCILEDIGTQNLSSMEEKQRFETSFASFLLNFFREMDAFPDLPREERRAAVRMATFYWMEIVSRAQDEDLFDHWFVLLRSFYDQSTEDCEWLLELLSTSHAAYLRYMLLENKHQHLREKFATSLVARSNTTEQSTPQT